MYAINHSKNGVHFQIQFKDCCKIHDLVIEDECVYRLTLYPRTAATIETGTA